MSDPTDSKTRAAEIAGSHAARSASSSSAPQDAGSQPAQNVTPLMAQQIREMLLPVSLYDDYQFQMRSFFEPASQYGGDWFYFLPGDTHVWVGIGDVTGHDLNSTFMTMASRAAFSVFEEESNLSPAEVLQRLNKVIFKTGIGHWQMTFFLIKLELATGKITYANASHEPCYCLNAAKGTSTLLTEVTGPRLGERFEATFAEREHTLEKDDTLFLYTDGLFEISTEDKPLTDRRLEKILLSTQNPTNLHGSYRTLNQRLKEMRKPAALNDDVSWVLFRYR